MSTNVRGIHKLEKFYEAAFGNWLQDTYPDIYYIKLQFLGLRGAPDRFILGEGFHLFMEWKRPGEKLRILQEYIHTLLTRAGLNVVVCTNVEEAKVYLEKFKANAKP